MLPIYKSKCREDILLEHWSQTKQVQISVIPQSSYCTSLILSPCLLHLPERLIVSIKEVSCL